MAHGAPGRADLRGKCLWSALLQQQGADRARTAFAAEDGFHVPLINGGCPGSPVRFRYQADAARMNRSDPEVQTLQRCAPGVVAGRLKTADRSAECRRRSMRVGEGADARTARLCPRTRCCVGSRFPGGGSAARGWRGCRVSGSEPCRRCCPYGSTGRGASFCGNRPQVPPRHRERPGTTGPE